MVIENKEHFSAWHQVLLVCSLPSLAAIIGFVFLPESPRYLLEAGREVEAMMVYQVIVSIPSSMLETIFPNKLLYALVALHFTCLPTHAYPHSLYCPLLGHCINHEIPHYVVP